MQYQAHRYADFFPMMTGEESINFEASIKSNGLIEKIVLYQGQILDGRNRYKACLAVGVQPTFEQFEGDDKKALDYVRSKNLDRRDLTSQQRAAIAVECDSEYQKLAEQAKEKQVKSGRFEGKNPDGSPKLQVPQLIAEPEVDRIENETRQKLAKTFGTNRENISKAKRVKDYTPELLPEVKAGRLDLNQAATIATQVKKEVKGAMQEVGKKPEPQSELTLTAPVANTKTGIETIQENGYTLHVWHDGAKNSTFNTANESIDWAWSTWNPVTGCLHSCHYCYARVIATSDRMASVYPKGFEPVFHPYRLDAPKATRHFTEQEISRKSQERRLDVAQGKLWAKNVFVCSMADLFGKWVPDDWIMRVFESVIKYDSWNYLFLTKYPQRLQMIGEKLGGRFPDNCWVGTTVDEQKRVKIAQDAFADIKATVKWLSLEPLLTQLQFTDLGMFDMVAIGGQSANSQVPAFQPKWEWVEGILWQARQSGTAVYFKENLTCRPKELPF